jgi:hypothetical protein
MLLPLRAGWRSQVVAREQTTWCKRASRMLSGGCRTEAARARPQFRQSPAEWAASREEGAGNRAIDLDAVRDGGSRVIGLSELGFVF